MARQFSMLWSPPAVLSNLNIVWIGNSVMGANGGITVADTPANQVAAYLTSIGRTFAIHDDTVGNTDTAYWANSLRLASVDARWVSTAGWVNVAVLGETEDYIDDTRGAAGDSFALTNPSGAGTADYNLYVSWAQGLKALHSGWLCVPVCMPDCNEPSTYASTSDNNNYRTARVASDTLKKANSTDFAKVIDAYSDAAFHGTLSLTYYQNAGNGQLIHLTEAGGDRFGLISGQALATL